VVPAGWDRRPLSLKIVVSAGASPPRRDAGMANIRSDAAQYDFVKAARRWTWTQRAWLLLPARVFDGVLTSSDEYLGSRYRSVLPNTSQVTAAIRETIRRFKA
jgi:hypothetical protein